MDDFIETGSGGGIGFGLCDDIAHAVIDEEKMTSVRKYHTITESKNGAGAVPIKTDKGWIHIAHGVRNTAAGLRYVIYCFATALDDPSRVIAEPGGFLIGPVGVERIGDVSNVCFTNGAIAAPDGKCTFITPPATPGCTFPPRILIGSPIMCSIPPPIRAAAWTV